MLTRRIRLEHWSSALNQGPVATKNMLGVPTSYARIPCFFSDQYDVGMEYSGYATDTFAALVAAQRPNSVARLTDPDIDLASLLA